MHLLEMRVSHTVLNISTYRFTYQNLRLNVMNDELFLEQILHYEL